MHNHIYTMVSSAGANVKPQPPPPWGGARDITGLLGNLHSINVPGGGGFCGFCISKWQFSKSLHIPVYDVGGYQGVATKLCPWPGGWALCEV